MVTAEFHRKGGVGAHAMLRLDDKINMALTADVPKVSRKAGGIIVLARNPAGRVCRWRSPPAASSG